MTAPRRLVRNGSLWAVFVGVNEYDDPNWGGLPFCGADASELAGLFQDPQRGYPARNTRLLVQPTAERRLSPTRSNVIAAVRDLSTIAEAEDVVLFGFFGHGLVVGGVTYLFPADGYQSGPEETAIELRWVQEALQQSKARVKALIVDACHSGSLRNRRAGGEAMSADFARTLQQLGNSEGWAVLSSCKQDELSHDYEEKRHGAFSYFLLEGLRGAADSDGDGLVTVYDAGRYAATMTSSWAFGQGCRQTPELRWNVAGGDLVLLATPEPSVIPQSPGPAALPLGGDRLPAGPKRTGPAAGASVGTSTGPVGSASGPLVRGDGLELLLHQNCWLSYDPLTFDPERAPNPAEEDLDRELEWVRSAGFTGVVTYGSRGALATVPRVARRHDLRVIMGVWDATPGSGEVDAALTAGEHADAFCVGHHGLNRRYSYVDLLEAIQTLRDRTGKPVTTTEAARLYENNPRLSQAGDWLFPDVQLSFRDKIAEPNRIDLNRDVPRIISLAGDMARLGLSLQRPLVCKMVLYPHDGVPGASPKSQSAFFQALYDAVESAEYGLPAKVSFVFHSAFDSPWKSTRPFFPWDPYTGLLNDDGTPRPAAREISSSFGAVTVR